MNLSKRDQGIIIVLIGIAVFIAAYLGVYTNYNDKTAAIDEEVAGLHTRLTELQSYADNTNAYRQGIDDAKIKMSRELESYPNDVREEDKIMYAVALEDEVGLHVSSVAFDEPQYLMELNGLVSNEDGSYSTVPLTAYRSAMSIVCDLSYPELKKTVDYINYTQVCTRLNTVSVSYDSETGELTGDMIIDKYYITGLDDAYYETDVPPVPIGTDNVFGTIESEAATPPEAS